jgi:hypothetical protein
MKVTPARVIKASAPPNTAKVMIPSVCLYQCTIFSVVTVGGGKVVTSAVVVLTDVDLPVVVRNDVVRNVAEQKNVF